MLQTRVLPLLAILADLATSPASAHLARQTQVDLSPFFNNKAAAIEGSRANFDGFNGSYPAEYLPTGVLLEKGIQVSLIAIQLLHKLI